MDGHIWQDHGWIVRDTCSKNKRAESEGPSGQHPQYGCMFWQQQLKEWVKLRHFSFKASSGPGLKCQIVTADEHTWWEKASRRIVTARSESSEHLWEHLFSTGLACGIGRCTDTRKPGSTLFEPYQVE